MKKPKEDPRVYYLSTEALEYVAGCPTGGSGEGAYITGRIQCMAQALLEYKKRFGDL